MPLELVPTRALLLTLCEMGNGVTRAELVRPLPVSEAIAIRHDLERVALPMPISDRLSDAIVLFGSDPVLISDGAVRFVTDQIAEYLVWSAVL